MANMRYDGGDREDILSCSFCGKSQYDVPRLFSGVNCYICIDCIRTAYIPTHIRIRNPWNPSANSDRR